VVFREVGSPDTRDGREVAKTFAEVLGRPLPLCPVPDLAAAAATLDAEFPHAREVTARLLSGIAGRPFVRMPPTVLVGNKGCGKSTYALRLLAVLGVPSTLEPCGGLSDAALAGTARKWHTSEPSLPAALALRFRSASPGIVLDEIEKTGTSRANGNLLDVLHGLLGTATSQRWRDPYLAGECDLSNVIWIATANAVDGLPGTLRDRMRVARFPDPSADHLPTLAQAALRNAAGERGGDPLWAAPLDAAELAALARFWKGGSIRRLEKFVEGVAAARGAVRH
jgi:hypothetical protein